MELIANHNGKDGWVLTNKEYNSKFQIPIRFGEITLEDSFEKMSLSIFYHGDDYFMECLKERPEFGDMNYDAYFYKSDNLKDLIKEYLIISKQSKNLLGHYLNKFERLV